MRYKTSGSVAIIGLAASLVLLGGCRIVPNETVDEGLSLANPTLKPSPAVQLTPAEGETIMQIPTANPNLSPTGSVGRADLPQKNAKAVIKTAQGEIVITLFNEKAPQTVNNFLTKAKNGFYDGLTFHRVEDWVIQGGDPKGDGTGGGTMPTELNDLPFKIGSIGVARGGNKAISNDAQFFICTKECNWLTGDYTNFGQVESGMEVALKIAKGDRIEAITEAVQ